MRCYRRQHYVESWLWCRETYQELRKVRISQKAKLATRIEAAGRVTKKGSQRESGDTYPSSYLSASQHLPQGPRRQSLDLRDSGRRVPKPGFMRPPETLARATYLYSRGIFACAKSLNDRVRFWTISRGALERGLFGRNRTLARSG